MRTSLRVSSEMGTHAVKSRWTTDERWLRAVRRFASDSFWQSCRRSVLHNGAPSCNRDSYPCAEMARVHLCQEWGRLHICRR